MNIIAFQCYQRACLAGQGYVGTDDAAVAVLRVRDGDGVATKSEVEALFARLEDMLGYVSGGSGDVDNDGSKGGYGGNGGDGDVAAKAGLRVHKGGNAMGLGRSLRGLGGRCELTGSEVRLLHGVLSRLAARGAQAA